MSIKENKNSINYKNLEITGIGFRSRKSSAEIVSEARSMLFGPGAKLVSTRRPITPRDSKRQLYGGKQAPPGRPPSSFSLRYLQLEDVRPLPPLEPICQQSFISDKTPGANTAIHFRRSGSVETLLDIKSLLKIDDNALEEDIHKETCILPLQLRNSKELENDQEARDCLHPLWQRQTKSFDLPLKSSTQNFPIEFYREKNEFPTNTEKKLKVLKDESEEQSTNEEYQTALSASGNNFQDGNTSPILCPAAKSNVLVKTNLLSQSSLDTLIELLKAHNGIRDCNEETVQHISAILVELYNRVKRAVKAEWRGAILGGLYGLVECISPKILLAVARVVLALSVTGSNLTGACKLVFKVARNESNDYLFSESDVPELLIEGLGRASPLEDPEACIYGYGAVRFLFNASFNTSHSSNTCKNIIHPQYSEIKEEIISKKQKCLTLRLSRAGAVQLMILHLQILNEAGLEKSLIGQPLHALYQLSAALRALAGVSHFVLEENVQNKSVFTDVESDICYQEQLDKAEGEAEDSNLTFTIDDQNLTRNINLELACPHLIAAAEIFVGESEIQRNIVRTLSVLSDHDICCNTLTNHVGRIGMLLSQCYIDDTNFLEVQKPLGLLSRLGYILGNIMAKFDNARLQFYHNDAAMDNLVNTINLYSTQNLLSQSQNEDSAVEVLIKLIRVIANMSVNAEVGSGIGSKPLLGKIILRLILKINEITTAQMTEEMEELLQAVLGAMHNLCFYQDQTLVEKFDYCQELNPEENTEASSMNELIPKLSIALCNTLNASSVQIKAEASRVLGNMTRNSAARDAFCTAGGLKAIVVCLESEDHNLISGCSGVLVNLLGDLECRILFHDMCGPSVLQNTLEKSVKQFDWLLAGIVCQAFWNYLIDSQNVISALGEIETDKILTQLLEYLDEENIFQGGRPDVLWEQFACVATDLLERIQTSLEQSNEVLEKDD